MIPPTGLDGIVGNIRRNERIGCHELEVQHKEGPPSEFQRKVA